MQAICFLLFLFISHVLLMQIFKLSTYHAYFWKVLPGLIIYAALAGWLFFKLELHQFFLWQLVLGSLWLFYIARKQTKEIKSMLELVGEDADAVRMMALSFADTQRYYSYSSFIYIAVFVITYLWILNH